MPEEQDSEIAISKDEYDDLCYWAKLGQKKGTFWSDALKNPEGTKALKEGIKRS